MAWIRPWIKLWTELLDDPKYLDLGPAQQAVWVNLLLATTRSPEPGVMLRPNGSPMGLEQVRGAVRAFAMTSEEFAATVEELESMEMVHWENGALAITHWHERQDPESPAQRMRRMRERQRVSNGYSEEVVRAVTGRNAPTQEWVTPPVTQRNAPGNGSVTPRSADVDPPVTQRNAEGPSGVTERNKPADQPPAVTERNAKSPDAVTQTVTQRHTRSLEGKRGVGQGPTPEEQRERRNPSGANAPTGLAPHKNSRPTFDGLPGEARELPEEGQESSAARAGTDGEDSSPGSDAAGGGDHAAPRAMTSRDQQDSSPGDAAGGGEETAPRAMTSRRKTGGNPEVDAVLSAIQELWGQPIVHWGKEAREVKAALAKGFQPGQIVACWKAAQESSRWKGRWMPLAYLVEDLGEFVKSGEKPLRKWGSAPGEEEGHAQGRSTLPTAEDWRQRRGRW